MKSETLAVRFWAKVDKNGPIPAHRPELGACWIWTASKLPKGYGMIGLGPKPVLAHRVSFFLEHGRWPEPCGLHRCDNPSCVRPAHLFEGSRKDNIHDCITKGRARHLGAFGEANGSHRFPHLRAGLRNGAHTKPDRRRRGETHGMSKVTEAIVREIRAMRAAGFVYRVIAEKYGLKIPQVHRICERKSWGHVT